MHFMLLELRQSMVFPRCCTQIQKMSWSLSSTRSLTIVEVSVLSFIIFLVSIEKPGIYFI